MGKKAKKRREAKAVKAVKAVTKVPLQQKQSIVSMQAALSIARSRANALARWRKRVKENKVE